MQEEGSASPGLARESALVERWLHGLRGPLRLQDGRAIKVVFPGMRGGAAGPDIVDAIVEVGGDVARGAVEFHLLASGWESHGHHRDPAYAAVMLHVVGRNDSRRLATESGSGRGIPILVMPERQEGFPPPFTPPCALAGRAAASTAPALRRLAKRRMRQKSTRATTLVASEGAGQALYTLLLEYLAGSANRGAFAAIARALPLAALLERAPNGGERAMSLAAELKGAATHVALKRAGLRPMAGPARRLEAAGALVHRLWPPGAAPKWPDLECGDAGELMRALRAPGIGRSTAVELAVNAVLPVGLAAGIAGDEALAVLGALPSPGTYGKLKRLEGWLGHGAFQGAADVQGALLLHQDYCTRGKCGQCPLSWSGGGST